MINRDRVIKGYSERRGHELQALAAQTAAAAVLKEKQAALDASPFKTTFLKGEVAKANSAFEDASRKVVATTDEMGMFLADLFDPSKRAKKKAAKRRRGAR